MGYVRNLIPQQYRVKFNGDFKIAGTDSLDNASVYVSTGVRIIQYILASLFFLIAFIFAFGSIFSGLLCFFIGFILLPEGRKFIENTVHHKISNGVVLTLVSLFFSISVFLLPDAAANPPKQAVSPLIDTASERNEKLARLETELKEKTRLDSLHYYEDKAQQKIKKGSYVQAVKCFDLALRFATKEQATLVKQRAAVKAKGKLWKSALDDYNYLISKRVDLTDTWCDRAVCLDKLRFRQEAVNDLKLAMNQGSNRAEQLHEKINPLKRRVAYYITRCCDGSTSNAKGRGACSHHDGVCDWNEPVYEEYRQYE